MEGAGDVLAALSRLVYVSLYSVSLQRIHTDSRGRGHPPIDVK